MLETLLTTLAKELPAVAVMSLFCWAMLQIFKQVMNNYQKLIDTTLINLARAVDSLAERLDFHHKGNDHDTRN